MLELTKLTPFHERFCEEYVRCGSGIEAYKKVHKRKSKWMTDSYARRRAAYLISGAHPLINKRIEEMRATIEEEHKELRNRIVRELSHIALSDMRDVADWDNDKVVLKNSDKLSDAAASAVSEIVQGRDGVKVKMHSKPEALDKLSRIFGLYKDRTEVTGANGKPLIPENQPDEMEVARFLAHLLEKQARIVSPGELTVIEENDNA